MIERNRAILLPYISFIYWPNIAPPIGLIKKPTAKTPKALSMLTNLSSDGKNTSPIMLIRWLKSM